MSKTWLVIDVSNLAFRAYHSTGGLNFGPLPTGVAYGLLRELSKLSQTFDSTDFVFCFDSDSSLRKKACPGYKERKFDASRGHVRSECEKLRTDYLPSLGLTNLFRQDGYEADDLIASMVRNTSDGSLVRIVSSDEDLYQLLEGGVSIYKPGSGKVYTKKSLYDQWGVRPDQWPLVKALAGCKSDNVAGVAGVGTKTACDFFRGELDPNHKVWKACSDWVGNNVTFDANLKLVTLPYPGTKRVVPERQRGIPDAAWDDLVGRLGIKSLSKPGAKAKKGILG